MKSALGIKWRIAMTIGVLALIGTLAASHYASQLSRQQIETDQKLLLQNIASRMASQLAQDLNTRGGEIQFLTHQDAIRNPDVSLDRKLNMLEQMKRSYPYYKWIGMTDAQGNIIAGTGGLLVGKNVHKRSWFIEGAKGLHFGDAHDAFLLAKLMPKPIWDDLPLRLLDVSAPIYDENHHLIGVICGHLSLDWAFEVREKLLNQLGDPHIGMVVLNHTGDVLMGTPALPSLKANLSTLKAYRSLNLAVDEMADNESWPDGKEYLTAAARVGSFGRYPGMGWVVVARKPANIAFAAAERLASTILLLGVISAGLFVVLSWYLLNYFLAPLEKVARAANQIRGNDLSAPIPLPSGNDEVAIFARSLVGLVSRLQDANHDLLLAGHVFDGSGQGIMIADNQNRILRINPAFTQITGYRQEDVAGKNPAILASGHHDPAFYRSMWETLTTTGRWRGEIWNRKKDGEIFPEWLTINALMDDSGQITHFIGIFDDISEKMEYERQLSQLANYDRLTDLPNRNLLQNHLEEQLELGLHDSATTQIALLFVDLDRFKNINDTLGHVVGDQVLVEVAQRFRPLIGDSRFLARWGGDEFVVVLQNTDKLGAVAVAQQLIDSMNAPVHLHDNDFHLSLSVGIAFYPDNGQDFKSLLRAADSAMYEAKKTGANQYRIFEHTIQENIERFVRIENALRQAITADYSEFHMEFQPQFRADGTLIQGVEALIRWTSKELGAIPPGEFIPVAEKTGQIIPIGRWIIREVARKASELRQITGHDIPISVNLSTQQLQDPELIPTLESCCQRYGLTPQSLVLEITESAIMDDEFAASELIAQLRKAGHPLSIDDFGTGFSCLSYILRIKPAEIKVDKSFIDNLLTDEDSHKIVAFTIALAGSMGIRIVAEGVETEEQRTALEQMGDVRLQGYLLARPSDFDQLCVLLGTGS